MIMTIVWHVTQSLKWHKLIDMAVKYSVRSGILYFVKCSGLESVSGGNSSIMYKNFKKLNFTCFMKYEPRSAKMWF